MVFLAMIIAGKTHDTALIDAGRVTAEVLDQSLLNRPELQHLAAGNKPVGVQRFLRPDNHGRGTRKSIDLCLLFFKAAAVHLHKLGIDAGNAFIIMTAVVDHKENAAMQGIVLFQRILD